MLALPYNLLANHQSLVSNLLALPSTHDLQFLNHFLARLPLVPVATKVELLNLHFDQAYECFVLGSHTIEVSLMQCSLHFAAFMFDFR